jgi:hypothetical protein
MGELARGGIGILDFQQFGAAIQLGRHVVGIKLVELFNLSIEAILAAFAWVAPITIIGLLGDIVVAHFLHPGVLRFRMRQLAQFQRGCLSGLDAAPTNREAAPAYLLLPALD